MTPSADLRHKAVPSPRLKGPRLGVRDKPVFQVPRCRGPKDQNRCPVMSIPIITCPPTTKL